MNKKEMNPPVIYIRLHSSSIANPEWESGWIKLTRVPMVGEFINPRVEIGICKVIRVLHTSLEDAHAAEVWAIKVSDKEWHEALRFDL